VSRWIVDASLALGWYLRDEDDRAYNLAVLTGLKENDAVVPALWLYEVANGLVMAHRRKRLAESDLAAILASLRSLPITIEPAAPDTLTRLPALARDHQLTAYDAAYIDLALRLKLPIATKDGAMKRAMAACGIDAVKP
jgi:predicted nucleic acid-binding protein